jgi:hypothetical protein
MIIYYYKIVINNKLEDLKYIKANYNLNIKYSIFKKYILEQKNLGIFTIFNNIPDSIHPLEDELYLNYGCYLSFINPNKFNIKNTDIIVQDHNIFKFKFYKYPFIYQDTAPYNMNKKYIYINLKFFNFNYYKSYAIIFITNNHNVYSYTKNILKKKENNKWIIDNTKINELNKDIIYVNILRPINQDDITNTFNSYYKIKKDTKIYSYHLKKKDKPLWFSLDPNEVLYDPYHIYYKNDDKVFQHIGIIRKNIKCLNLSIDILSNNKIIKTNDITTLLNEQYNIKKLIFNGNLNYIKYKKTNLNIWKDNQGKRLLNEVYLKTSNFIMIDKYYFDFLNNYDFYYFINSYGYYEKLNKFYTYELGFSDDPYTSLIKLININETIIK